MYSVLFFLCGCTQCIVYIAIAEEIMDEMGDEQRAKVRADIRIRMIALHIARMKPRSLHVRFHGDIV